jgi:outer membrane lipoprotein-sorting protein
VRRAGSHPHLLFILIGAALSGCAPKLTPLPSGPGTPASDYASAYSQATDRCQGVRTLRASLGLSGRAGETPLRARIDAGFAAPGQIRLEGSPPIAFGRPVFILVGRGAEATLVLPRDKRVLTSAAPEAIIETLAGVALTADELRAVVSGCGFGFSEPSGGRRYGTEWMALESNGGTTWLRHANAVWRVAAVVRPPLEIRYEQFASSHPSRIRIRTTPGGTAKLADITLNVSDVDMNVPLEPDVFRVEVPDDAVPITLEELRRAVPHSGDNKS